MPDSPQRTDDDLREEVKSALAVQVERRARQIADERTGPLVEELSRTVANLRQHIEDRANEIAGPLIALAEEEAAARVAAIEKSWAVGFQRWRDLEAELRRQVGALRHRAGFHDDDEWARTVAAERHVLEAAREFASTWSWDPQAEAVKETIGDALVAAVDALDEVNAKGGTGEQQR